MKTSAAGRKLIEEFEGLYLHTYDDGTGTLTIGYGHTTAAGPPHVYRGMTISREQADAILSADLASVEISVAHHVTAPLAQNQFDALVSFDFNTGALRHSNVLIDLNNRRYERVPLDLMAWDHAHVHGRMVVMPGLERRRKAEGNMFKTPAAQPAPSITREQYQDKMQAAEPARELTPMPETVGMQVTGEGPPAVRTAELYAC